MQNTKKEQKVDMLPLSSDYVFKRIFGKDGNERILKSLLEAILEINIRKIKIKNPEIPKESIKEKLSVLDIKAEINKNIILDIEMQVGNTTAIDRRLVVYSSKLIAGDIKVSGKYPDAKNTIVICITTDNILKRNSYLSVAKLRFEKTKDKRYIDMGYKKEDEYLTDMVSYYIIELTKLKENKPRTADLLEKWLLIIGGDEEMMKKCKKEEGEIKEAIEQLEEMSSDEKERELYEIRERSRLVYNTEMYEARRKGLADGKKEGKREGKIEKAREIAKNLLENGVSIEIIKKSTGLTENEIENLKNGNLN